MAKTEVVLSLINAWIENHGIGHDLPRPCIAADDVVEIRDGENYVLRFYDDYWLFNSSHELGEVAGSGYLNYIEIAVDTAMRLVEMVHKERSCLHSNK